LENWLTGYEGKGGKNVTMKVKGLTKLEKRMNNNEQDVHTTDNN